jgi:hypothetical protein
LTPGNDPVPSIGGALVADVHADAGHLYAVRFHTGVIKVGRAQRPEQRVATHRFNAELHGSHVEAVWISGPLDKIRQREHELVRFCEINGYLAAGQEYFRGLDLQAIIDFAAARGIPTQVVRETPPELDQGPPTPKIESIATRLASIMGSEVRRKRVTGGVRLELDLHQDLCGSKRQAVLTAIADTDTYGHDRTRAGEYLWALILNEAEQNPVDR